ncbi:CinA family protein [Alcanivorax sp. 1008]|uniref:CinA family protein n=1 Tax=Alcanivorax sp. 1008 TaxID=2816853 RepID=UPI001DB3AE26|nr:nicotinamide-nucleotide amidohydrolase family protein [Alcanivorax sp. 1008]MCC1495687.1 CinA family protein [Alcanivorax sp. 1008]
MENQIYVLAERAGRLLARHKILLVTAESCTGGWIAEAITAVAGSSAWFERGFVSYSNQAKQDMLGVSSDLLNRCGAVSQEVVLEMARGAIQRSKGHISVAVSGIAGPDGGTADKPVGTVWIAWGQKLGHAEAESFLFSGDRQAVREQTVVRALQGLIARMGG